MIGYIVGGLTVLGLLKPKKKKQRPQGRMRVGKAPKPSAPSAPKTLRWVFPLNYDDWVSRAGVDANKDRLVATHATNTYPPAMVLTGPGSVPVYSPLMGTILDPEAGALQIVSALPSGGRVINMLTGLDPETQVPFADGNRVAKGEFLGYAKLLSGKQKGQSQLKWTAYTNSSGVKHGAGLWTDPLRIVSKTGTIDWPDSANLERNTRQPEEINPSAPTPQPDATQYQAIYDATLSQFKKNLQEMQANAFREEFYGEETPEYQAQTQAAIREAVAKAQDGAAKIASVLSSPAGSALPDWLGLALVGAVDVGTVVAAFTIGPEALVAAGVVEAGATIAEAMSAAGTTAVEVAAAAETTGVTTVAFDAQLEEDIAIANALVAKITGGVAAEVTTAETVAVYEGAELESLTEGQALMGKIFADELRRRMLSFGLTVIEEGGKVIVQVPK